MVISAFETTGKICWSCPPALGASFPPRALDPRWIRARALDLRPGCGAAATGARRSAFADSQQMCKSSASAAANEKDGYYIFTRVC